MALYYGIGRFVSQNARNGFWGKNAIGNISRMLKEELPGLKGFSEEDIKLMRKFYETWLFFGGRFYIFLLDIKKLICR